MGRTCSKPAALAAAKVSVYDDDTQCECTLPLLLLSELVGSRVGDRQPSFRFESQRNPSD